MARLWTLRQPARADGTSTSTSASTGLRRRRLLAAAALVLFAAAAAIYGAALLARTGRVYRFVKSGRRGWTEQVHASDAELGFAPLPGARGAEILPLGPPVPVRFDADGFRVPIDEPVRRSGRPLVLALGDSWTYGAACLAEEAYPYRVGRELGGSAINAAVVSYGLSQMLIQARRLVPRFKPDWLLVQYSEWLVSRAREGFAPVYVGALPTPFMVTGRDGRVEIHPPVFATKAFAVPLNRYRTTPRASADIVSFFFRVGLPLFVRDDIQILAVEARRRLGALPPYAAPPDDVVRAVYGELSDLCAAHGTRMVVVLLGPPPSALWRSILGKGARVVDAQSVLCGNVEGGCTNPMPVANEAYRRAYAHWRGSPAEYVDPHPNPEAHAVIAREIVRAIRASEG